MDDITRFEQLEGIIVELLRKQDRTIEEIGRLREAVVSQQLLLSRMQGDVNRLEVESATTRRQMVELTQVVNKGFQELFIAYERNERLLQETALILAEHELFHQEVRGFQKETRTSLAENKVFQQETRAVLVETREALTETRATLNKILALLTKS